MKLEERLKELREKATPGPWKWINFANYNWGIPTTKSDSQLVALAVNALPALEELLAANRRVASWGVHPDAPDDERVAWADLDAALAACDSIP